MVLAVDELELGDEDRGIRPVSLLERTGEQCSRSISPDRVDALPHPEGALLGAVAHQCFGQPIGFLKGEFRFQGLIMYFFLEDEKSQFVAKHCELYSNAVGEVGKIREGNIARYIKKTNTRAFRNLYRILTLKNNGSNTINDAELQKSLAKC